jgi:hypothetical protein
MAVAEASYDNGGIQRLAFSAQAEPQSTSDLSQQVDGLEAALTSYRTTNDRARWQEFMRSFAALASNCLAKHLDPVSQIKNLPGFADLGLTVFDSGALKVYAFTKVAEADELYLLWQLTAPKPTAVLTKRGNHQKRAPVKTVCVVQPVKSQLLKWPVGTAIEAARLIMGTEGAASTIAQAEHHQFLVLLGKEAKTNKVHLTGYELKAGRWTPSPDLFAVVPPFLTQNLDGKISFIGNNLVISFGQANPGSIGNVAADPYKITLVFAKDHYALDNSDLNPATNVAAQFVQAVQSGRIDLVKGWLLDDKLASIPDYLGLYGHGTMPYKIIPINALHAPGIARFRVVTFSKNDLILDVCKFKNQWAVKALFIAPPDALVKKIVSTSAAP